MVKVPLVERFGVLVLRQYECARLDEERQKLEDMASLMKLIDRYWPAEMDAARTLEAGF